ncbi:MAG: tRNA (adenosine(37)-N6)-dimethylallyltransferase MiaA [Oscillospiraceae bacterium]
MSNEKKLIPLVVIVGPTASGKTKLAVDIAKKFNGEIVSADSMQIYKYMSIGTAKPTIEEMSSVPHYMIDFLEPNEKFSVAKYVSMAKQHIADIHSRNKLPILVGGTGLYINSLIDNIEFAQMQENTPIRDELYKIAEEKGNDFLFDMLKEIDENICKELHPNNLGRVIRAIEVYKLTGKNMSWHKEHSKMTPSDYKICMIGLTASDRQKLYDRINNRVSIMVENGLLDEAKNLFSSVYSGTAKQAIGYKELKGYFENEEKLEDCLEKIRMGSRRYAKRQLTWFRKDERINWIQFDLFSNYKEIFDFACETLVKNNII